MLKLHKLYILLALILLIVPLLVACGDSPTVVPAATPTAAVATKAPATATAAPTTAPATATVAPTTAPATATVAPTTKAAATVASLPDDLSFQTFTSDDKKFSIAFPTGQPQASDNNTTVSGEPVVVHSLVQNVNNAAYFAVHYADYPADAVSASTPDKVMDLTLQALTSASVKLGTVNAITLGSVPGKEFMISDSSSNTDSYGRVYLDGNRLYELVITYPAGKNSTQNTKIFFDSFTLTGDVATTKPTAGSGNSKDDTVEVKLDQVFYDNLAEQLKGATDPQITFYTSNTDSAALVKLLNTEIQQEGYKSQDASQPLIGQYSKAGQPDVFFSVSDAPTDADGVKSLWTTLDLTANQTAVTNLLADIKGAKTMVVSITGVGVLDSINGVTAGNATPATGGATPTAGDTTPATGDATPTTGDSGLPTEEVAGNINFSQVLERVLIDGKDDLSANVPEMASAYPGVTDLTAAGYPSSQPVTNLTNQLDTVAKKYGFTFVPTSGTATAPVKVGANYVGIYTKDGQPDVFVQIFEIPTDAAARLQAFIQAGVPAAKAQEMADNFQGEKSIIIALTGTGLAKVVLSK